MEDVCKGVNVCIIVDLENQIVIILDGQFFFFEVDVFCKYCLLNGLDDIGLIMEKVVNIDIYEVQMV